MKTINRTVITILAKQPYIDWANSFDDGGPTMDTESIRATSLLIPDKYDEFNYEQFLKKKFKIIFEEELASWMGDPDSWPSKRNYSLFRKWFKVIASDAVLDFGTDAIYTEEY